MTDVSEYGSDDLRWRSLPRPVLALVAARTANRLGAFTMSFLAVVLVEELGATLAQAGAVVAAFGVATVPSRLLGGVLADRWGARPTIVVGLVLCAAAQLVVAGATSLAPAAAGAVALGLAYEIYEPPSQALVADLTGERQRPVAYGLYGAALAAAGALAGLLATSLGTVDLRLLLVADAATCMAAAAVVLAAVRVPHRTLARLDRPPTALAWRDRRLLLVLAAGTGYATLHMALVVGLPLTLGERGLPPERAGLLLTVSAVVVVAGQPLLRLPALADPRRALAVGHLLLGAGLLVTAQAGTLVTFAVATAVWSLGDVLLLGQYWTVVSRLAPAGARASYLAVFGLCWGAATTLAPVLVSRGLGGPGPVGLWTTAAVVALVLAPLQLALPGADRSRRARRARSRPRPSGRGRRAGRGATISAGR